MPLTSYAPVHVLIMGEHLVHGKIENLHAKSTVALRYTLTSSRFEVVGDSTEPRRGWN